MQEANTERVRGCKGTHCQGCKGTLGIMEWGHQGEKNILEKNAITRIYGSCMLKVVDPARFLRGSTRGAANYHENLTTQTRGKWKRVAFTGVQMNKIKANKRNLLGQYFTKNICIFIIQNI